MAKVRNFSKIAPNLAFPEFNFYDLYHFNVRKERIGQNKEVVSSPRDGRELRSDKEKHEAEAGT